LQDRADVGQEILLRGEPPRLAIVKRVYETGDGVFYEVFRRPSRQPLTPLQASID
jgi:hypothetical protein